MEKIRGLWCIILSSEQQNQRFRQSQPCLRVYRVEGREGGKEEEKMDRLCTRTPTKERKKKHRKNNERREKKEKKFCPITTGEFVCDASQVHAVRFVLGELAHGALVVVVFLHPRGRFPLLLHSKGFLRCVPAIFPTFRNGMKNSGGIREKKFNFLKQIFFLKIFWKFFEIFFWKLEELNVG